MSRSCTTAPLAATISPLTVPRTVVKAIAEITQARHDEFVIVETLVNDGREDGDVGVRAFHRRDGSFGRKRCRPRRVSAWRLSKRTSSK